MESAYLDSRAAWMSILKLPQPILSITAVIFLKKKIR